MEKTNIISDLIKRIDNLEKKSKKKAPTKKPDEDVCPECGGDLLWVEEGIVLCKKCNKYFEQVEEAEEEE